MKLFLIRNLDNKCFPYRTWAHRKNGDYSGGYLTSDPEIVTTTEGRYIKLRNFVNAVIESTQRHNARWIGDESESIDKSKLAVIEIDFTNIASPYIKFHTLEEALALK